MIARVRAQLSYANVMATTAVFIALGGGAYAATLANNSVKSKTIKNGQVKSADIGDGQVMSADIGAGAVTNPKLGASAVTTDKIFNGTLLGEDVGANALGGTQIDESTLGTVPSATSAASATNATNATNAANATNAGDADTTNGVSVQRIQFVELNGLALDTPLLNLGGLVLTASCGSGGSQDMTVTATTTANDASLQAVVTDGAGAHNVFRPNFLTTDSAIVSGDNAGNNDGLQGTLTYTRTPPSGPPIVVNVVYGGDEDVFTGNGTACIFSGTAFSS
jgi:hypothetical protein